jgi:type II secretory pathway component PulF
MTIFYYSAKKKDAQTVKGQIEADNKDDAIEKISQLGLLPVTVDDRLKQMKEERLFLGQRIGPKDLYAFSRQMASLLKAGVTLLKALHILNGQIRHPAFKQVISNVASGIQDGRSFSDCLQDYPRIFSGLFVAMMRAGEEGGQLREMLLKMAEYQKAQYEMYSKVRTAMAYPMIMLVMGVATIIFMLTSVMPRITTMLFTDQGSLPWPTLIVLKASQFLQVTWWLIAILVLFGGFLFKRWLDSVAGHRAFSQFQLSIPVFKNFIIKVELARFCRTLELLIKSGITILRALTLATPVVSNDLLRDHLIKCSEELSAGNSLGQSLKKSKFIPNLLGDVIAVGEESGSLADSLQDMADNYEQDTNEIIKIMTTIFEPLMIVLVGGVVGFIVFAMLMPIFQMDVFR